MTFTVDDDPPLIDEEEAAENAAAEIIGYRTNPQKGTFFAVSMLRSLYRPDFHDIAALSMGERTREQLDLLSIGEVSSAVEFIAFCAGYLTARMFWPTVGEGAVLSRVVLPDHEPVPDAARRDSIERAAQWLPALSEIHDNRGGPRDSRMVQKLMAGYLAILIEDPRPSTLDTLLGGYSEGDPHRTSSGLSARQIAETLDRSRLWTTLGWRRGLAERRFRLAPRGAYVENIAGDVRILFEEDGVQVRFSDIRRIRSAKLTTLRDHPHPCDDAVVTAWIADNCTFARPIWEEAT